MNRRKFLGVIGSGSTLALAGCASGGETSPDDNAAKKATNTPDNPDNTKTTKQTTTTTSQDTQLKLALGEVAKLDTGVHATVESIEMRDSFESSGFEQTPADGMQFAFVKVTAENKGEEAQWLPAPMDMTALVDGDQISDFMYTGSDAFEIESSKSQPGVSEEGYIVYEVPEGTSSEDVQIQWYKEGFSETGGEFTIDVRWNA